MTAPVDPKTPLSGSSELKSSQSTEPSQFATDVKISEQLAGNEPIKDEPVANQTVGVSPVENVMAGPVGSNSVEPLSSAASTEPAVASMTPVNQTTSSLEQGTTSLEQTVSSQPIETLPPISSEPEKAKDKMDEEDDDDNEPEVVEKVIIKEKNKGVGCFGFIRNITCFVISMILLIIAAIIAIIIFKPAFITEPLKVFLNGDYKPSEASSGTSAETVKNYVDEVTNASAGEVTFQLTEDQITTLVREKFDDNVDIRTGLEENKLQLFIDIAQKGEPLWLIIELNDSGDKLSFSRIGFGRLNTPMSLRNFVKERAFDLVGGVLKDFNFDTSENLAGNVVGGDLRDGVSIKDVKFAPDLMLVTVEL